MHSKQTFTTDERSNLKLKSPNKNKGSSEELIPLETLPIREKKRGASERAYRLISNQSKEMLTFPVHVSRLFFYTDYKWRVTGCRRVSGRDRERGREGKMGGEREGEGSESEGGRERGREKEREGKKKHMKSYYTA